MGVLPQHLSTPPLSKHTARQRLTIRRPRSDHTRQGEGDTATVHNVVRGILAEDPDMQHLLVADPEAVAAKYSPNKYEGYFSQAHLKPLFVPLEAPEDCQHASASKPEVSAQPSTLVRQLHPKQTLVKMMHVCPAKPHSQEQSGPLAPSELLDFILGRPSLAQICVDAQPLIVMSAHIPGQPIRAAERAPPMGPGHSDARTCPPGDDNPRVSDDFDALAAGAEWFEARQRRMRDREAARVHGTCLRRRHSFDDWLGWETTAALPGRPQGVHVRNEAMHKRWLDFAEHHGIHVASDCPPAAIAGAPDVVGPCRAARGPGGGLGENQEEYAPADGVAKDLNEVGDDVDSGVEVEEKAQDEAVTPAEGGSIQAEQGDGSDSDGLYNLNDEGEQVETDGRKCKKTEDQKEAQEISRVESDME